AAGDRVGGGAGARPRLAGAALRELAAVAGHDAEAGAMALGAGKLAHSPILVQVAAQSVRFAAPAQLLLGAALDLADALARQAHRLADLLQRLRLLAVEPEAHADHLALLLVEAAHHPLDPALERGADHLDLGRGHAVLLERVAELEPAVVADRGRERD